MSNGELPARFDLVLYAGQISMLGYEALCRELKANRVAKDALLILGTPGGDPHAGFRIARALGHAYENFYALVPRYCKSAGTLILLGAKALYLDDMSELGPLDVQVKKGDEVIGRSSGLEFMKAVDYLQTQSMGTFRNYLMELTRGAGLSTRVASDIAAKLTSGLLEPITGQIDPLKLAEMQRATEIAFEYGVRLAEKSGNIRDDGVETLVTGYPSHGFVIDRKEARKVFIDVRRPEGALGEISESFRAMMNDHIHEKRPFIQVRSISDGESHGQATSDVDAPPPGAAPVEPALGDDSSGPQQAGVQGGCEQGAATHAPAANDAHDAHDDDTASSA